MVAPAFAAEANVVPATNEDIAESVDILTNAVQSLNTVFDENQAKGIIDVFKDFADTFKNAASYASAINASVGFLKLIGVIKDANSEALKSIMQQLTIIGEEITDMNKKLDRLAEQMNEMQASAEFNARTQKAISFESSWKDFEYRYMEDGMDKLISRYNSMMLTGLQLWCKNEGNDRTANGIDNTSLVLCYEKTANGYKLLYTTQNGRPDSAKEDARIVEIGKDILPQSMVWNVNTYRETLKNEIINNLKSKGGASFKDDAQLNETAEDAVNLLTYRVTAGQVNSNSEYSLEVARQFANYCSHLVSYDDGIDAISKVMFLTHAFEFQIADEYTAFMNQMAIKTGVYGSFALNVMGMSEFVTDAEKTAALDTYCNAVKTVAKTKKEGLTGNDNYCYLIGKNLCFGTITFNGSAEIKTKHRGSVNGYLESKINDTKVSLKYGKYDKSCDASQIIRESDAVLLNYYLNGNGIKLEFDFFNDKLGQGAAKNHGAAVVGAIGQQSLPLNDSTSLSVTNVIGSYFSEKSTTRLSSLPSGADTGDIVGRQMMNGSLMDITTGNVTTSNALSAIAIYGESHWYWETDEAAFLGGPSDIGTLTNSCTKQRSGVDFPATEYYTSYYTQSVSYNCLLSEEPHQNMLGATKESEILTSFANLCREIRESAQAAESKSNGQKRVLLILIVTASAVVICGIGTFVYIKKKR